MFIRTRKTHSRSFGLVVRPIARILSRVHALPTACRRSCKARKGSSWPCRGRSGRRPQSTATRSGRSAHMLKSLVRPVQTRSGATRSPRSVVRLIYDPRQQAPRTQDTQRRQNPAEETRKAQEQAKPTNIDQARKGRKQSKNAYYYTPILGRRGSVLVVNI